MTGEDKSVPSVGPRERLITSTIHLMRERGIAGMGITELVNHSGAARQSIYQHFPAGKSELVAAATADAGRWVARGLDTRISNESGPDPAGLIRTWVNSIADGMERHSYELGCPIAAASLAAPEEGPIREAATQAFDSWIARLTPLLTSPTRSPAEASTLAGIVIAAVEGAMLISRARGSSQPLREAAEFLSNAV